MYVQISEDHVQISKTNSNVDFYTDFIVSKETYEALKLKGANMDYFKPADLTITYKEALELISLLTRELNRLSK